GVGAWPRLDRESLRRSSPPLHHDGTSAKGAQRPSRWSLYGKSTASIPGIGRSGRRKCTARQGPRHEGDRGEAGQVSEKRKWPVTLGHLNTRPPEQLPSKSYMSR